MREWWQKLDVSELVSSMGEPYSKMLGIDLRMGDAEYVKWLLASILYAKPIREESATRTFKEFEASGLVDAKAIAEAGWDRLVTVLDKGGYTRYDFSTAARLLEVFGNLLKEYGGSLQRLYEASADEEDLERRLMGLGRGVGPITVSIFLRDMRSVWPKARPKPTPRVRKAMSLLGIGNLEDYARRHGLDIVRLETALHRYSRTLKERPQ
ncbi:hypothetical protein Mtc_2111 [Methanocella conradii HZ254]|uniref:Uncharacterized protein n=1 Tax=Methanocella conradii (strain DSM 24694 / JCM 17849 / CGMCC 1.5162 / HZ254) TaxID=1041930 RepID=H8I831_METCZ|nr:hypothetical protein [Methanocella conradii]AFD00849.1 hypothetical protein Mtc_2111 [Methanocella conradii HZ254]